MLAPRCGSGARRLRKTQSTQPNRTVRARETLSIGGCGACGPGGRRESRGRAARQRRRGCDGRGGHRCLGGGQGRSTRPKPSTPWRGPWMPPRRSVRIAAAEVRADWGGEGCRQLRLQCVRGCQQPFDSARPHTFARVGNSSLNGGENGDRQWALGPISVDVVYRAPERALTPPRSYHKYVYLSVSLPLQARRSEANRLGKHDQTHPKCHRLGFVWGLGTDPETSLRSGAHKLAERGHHPARPQRMCLAGTRTNETHRGTTYSQRDGDLPARHRGNRHPPVATESFDPSVFPPRGN